MKFNLLKRNVREVKNMEGAVAFALTPELELYTAVVTAGLSDTFYETADGRIDRLRQLIDKNDPEFVAKLAIYARNSMHLRSVPLVLAVELAKHVQKNGLVSKTVKGVVKRADEITELLAYYQLANKREGTKKLNRLSKQIQKGLNDSFNSFDEYQFAKYSRQTEVKLRDALFLVHPKPHNQEQQVIFNKIASNSLETAYTWESQLSVAGQGEFKNNAEKLESKKAKWEELIESGRLGYMATLRNLRNMLEAGVSNKHLEKVCTFISDEKAVANARQLPFRFLSAYREMQMVSSGSTPAILDSLEKAVAASIINLRGFDTDCRVMIACDVSSSMQKPISANSSVLLYDIGLMLAMLLKSKSKNVVAGIFGEKWKTINLPSKGILANVNEFHRREGEVGYSTNGYLVIDYLLNKKITMDKIMMFTDCQLWDSNHGGSSLMKSWTQYKKVAPDSRLYLFDLAGYGNIPIDEKQKDVFLIAGWSDKIFDVLQAIENGGNAIGQIKQTVL